MTPSGTPTHSGLAAEAASGAGGLLAQAARQDWRGPDPYDGLYSRWPAWLTAGRRRRQAIIQAHARAPFDVRRLYRRREDPRIAKALGLFGSAGTRLAQAGHADALALGLTALELLAADHAAGEAAWGYPFDVQTRWSFYPAGSPNVVVTCFAVQGLLEGAAATGRAHLRTRAVAAARWVLEELWVPRGFFAYHPTSDVNIHNANLLGALCVHLGLGDDPQARERARQAVERTLGSQAADGGFPYGEGAGLEWRDSFHTGFVLRCLMEMETIDPAVADAVRRGADAYVRFFDRDGRAKLWADREHPEDAHSAGTGLSTLALLCRRGVVDQEILTRVAQRTITTGLRDGHAVARRYRWIATTTHYLRWCDAHVALGLADAALALGGS